MSTTPDDTCTNPEQRIADPEREAPMSLPGPSNRRRLFAGHALFGKLPPDDLDALLLHARLESFPAGCTIFAKGSPSRSMMAILKGSVRISTPSPAGPDIVLGMLQPGDVFGEVALLDGADRTADARAVSDCELMVLDHRDFIPFLERRADLCLLLLRLLSQRLRNLTQQQTATAEVLQVINGTPVGAFHRIKRAPSAAAGPLEGGGWLCPDRRDNFENC